MKFSQLGKSSPAGRSNLAISRKNRQSASEGTTLFNREDSENAKISQSDVMISHSDPVDHPTPLHEALDVASRLSNRDKLRLITQVSAQLERDPRFDRDFSASQERSLLGALAHLGPAPSPENIDEARRDMLANFPREELAP